GNSPMWEVTTGDENNPQLQGVDVICTITNSSLEPLIALDKKITNEGTGADGDFKVGDTVEYEFVATNTGQVTLSDVTIADPLPGISTIQYGAWPGAAGELEPTESVTATATLEVTQAHVDAGSIYNTATVTGTPPVGPEVTNDDSEEVTFNTNSGIELTKT